MRELVAFETFMCCANAYLRNHQERDDGDEREERLVVRVSHTRVEVQAMVVETWHTLVAHIAMLRILVHGNVATLASAQ